ncbi:hypothetical protein [Enterococcus ratti]|uniref:Uncharacterized protein n=2 Tax=Enterococcus ratti TaxID=150033 RepID=A0A1L8WRK4_9ENTE|nr:hypothetical protein [Enterococcus ratti]OJG83644.1 hypothetical protein RV14_GL000878 [Enterococcus ratti]
MSDLNDQEQEKNSKIQGSNVVTASEKVANVLSKSQERKASQKVKVVSTKSEKFKRKITIKREKNTLARS